MTSCKANTQQVREGVAWYEYRYNELFYNRLSLPSPSNLFEAICLNSPHPANVK